MKFLLLEWKHNSILWQSSISYTGLLGRMTQRPSIWCSNYYFFFIISYELASALIYIDCEWNRGWWYLLKEQSIHGRTSERQPFPFKAPTLSLSYFFCFFSADLPRQRNSFVQFFPKFLVTQMVSPESNRDLFFFV